MMDQFLSRLLDKYGLARMVVAVVVGFIILWALAHFSAAPGGNVSVLFGLVQYTKSKADVPNSSSIVPNPKTAKSERALSLYEEMSKTNVSTAIGPDPKVMHGVTDKNFDLTVKALRSQRHLRALEALESGRLVAETPRETYFFISAFYLATTANGMAVTLGKQKVSRFGESNSDFEIHFLKSGLPIIVGFTSESDAVRIDSPAADVGKMSLSPVPWEKMTSLVSLYTDRITMASYRVLNIDARNRVVVLDCEIR